MKWEYSIRFFATDNLDDWEHHMNLGGEEGWEVIQILQVAGDKRRFMVLCKRPREG